MATEVVFQLLPARAHTLPGRLQEEAGEVSLSLGIRHPSWVPILGPFC